MHRLRSAVRLTATDGRPMGIEGGGEDGRRRGARGAAWLLYIKEDRETETYPLGRRRP
jgi:hypothetical protein